MRTSSSQREASNASSQIGSGMIDYLKTLATLLDADVEFVVVGAVSAALQGAQISTFDLDVVHARTEANVARLLTALTHLEAHYRGRTDLVPTADRLAGPGHQLLLTNCGPLDILGEIEEGLGYEELLPRSRALEIATRTVNVLSLREYLRIRRAHPRPRDIPRYPLLEAALSSEEE